MWIELHDTARDHPKVIKLARDLGTKQVYALGHLASLWTWVLRMAPDGNLSSFEDDDIEIAAQWEGEPGAFVEACVARKLLDRRGGALSVHDWEDFSGSLKAAERARNYRARKAESKATSRDGHARSRDITQTDQTRPTRPDQTDHGAERSAFASAPPPPAVVEIPLLDGKSFRVTQSLVDEWSRTYPALDVLLELRGLREWCLSNPTRMKRNGRAFCTRNLSRKQEQGPRITASRPAYPASRADAGMQAAFAAAEEFNARLAAASAADPGLVQEPARPALRALPAGRDVLGEPDVLLGGPLPVPAPSRRGGSA